MSKPVHVSKTGKYMSRLAKVAVLLVVAPQQVHIVHLTLVLLDHMHQMFLQIRRIHLNNRRQIKANTIRQMACNHTKDADRHMQTLVCIYKKTTNKNPGETRIIKND